MHTKKLPFEGLWLKWREHWKRAAPISKLLYKTYHSQKGNWISKIFLVVLSLSLPGLKFNTMVKVLKAWNLVQKKREREKEREKLQKINNVPI
jgi:hypothetical protein